jgi:hypothetical protein
MSGMNEGLHQSGSPRPILSTAEEVERVRGEQSVEQLWWKEAPRMQTAADIAQAVEENRAIRVQEVGEGYRLSPGIRDEFRALERNTYALMQVVARQWLERIRRRDINNSELYLRITSLARTAEYQKSLIEQGYPAALDSTHVKLGAFDILSKWFAENRPDLLQDLDAVLSVYAKDGMINWIKEPEIGAYHVALNPSKFH